MNSSPSVTLKPMSVGPRTSRLKMPFCCPLPSPSELLTQTNRTLPSITDVIGHRFNNAQLIADQFAANGYFVLTPDLFDKDPIPLNRPGDFDIMKWLSGEYHPQKKAHLPPTVDPIIDASIVELRTKYNAKVCRLE